MFRSIKGSLQQPLEAFWERMVSILLGCAHVCNPSDIHTIAGAEQTSTIPDSHAIPLKWLWLELAGQRWATQELLFVFASFAPPCRWRPSQRPSGSAWGQEDSGSGLHVQTKKSLGGRLVDSTEHTGTVESCMSTTIPKWLSWIPISDIGIEKPVWWIGNWSQQTLKIPIVYPKHE